MRFLLDESADYPLAAFLRVQGHEVTAIAHDYPFGLSDDAVLAIAVRENRIVITNDRDFGELLVRHRQEHRGVILFRLGNERIPIKQAWLQVLIRDHPEWLRHLVIVTDQGVRVREVGPDAGA